MRSSLTVAVKSSPPTITRAQDPWTSAASSPPLLSSLASHCHSYSRIRKSLSLVRASCRSSVAGTSAACSATSVLSLTTQLPSHAVSCMGPSWPTLQLSGKRILITSSLNVSPVLSPEGLSVSNSYMTLYSPRLASTCALLPPYGRYAGPSTKEDPWPVRCSLNLIPADVSCTFVKSI